MWEWLKKIWNFCPMDAPTGKVTDILRAAAHDQTAAREQLLPLVYDMLRKIAGQHMNGQPAGSTLQATALVNEAYLKLFAQDEPSWTDRGHFYAAAAQAMRHLLVDHARKRLSAKRGGGWQQVALTAADSASKNFTPDQFLALDAALEKLENVDERKLHVVYLRFFAGLNIEETAQSLEISPATVKREWQFAKAWLIREIGKHERLDS